MLDAEFALVYMTPERIQSETRAIQRLVNESKLAYIAIDECHCTFCPRHHALSSQLFQVSANGVTIFVQAIAH